jgi:hypothetical protein
VASGAKRSNIITCAAGEHLVAAGLSGLGFAVGMPRAGLQGFDLLVSTPKPGDTWTIQVKTSSSAVRHGSRGYFWEWPVGKHAADERSPSLWYVFVDLQGWPEQEKSTPTLYLLPSKVVAGWTRSILRKKWSRLWLRLGEKRTSRYPLADHYRVDWVGLKQRLEK